MPIRSADGCEPIGWFGMLSDVDERHRADENLRQNAERYHAFCDALPGMTWSASADGALEYVGERWSEVRGLSADAALGDGWLETLHPDDRARTVALWKTHLATGEPYNNSFRVRMADGSYRWQLVRARPRRALDGTIAQWIGVNVDIEEQRRIDDAREMFVALAENSSEFIATADRAGNVGYVNDAGRRLLELRAAADAPRRLSEFFADAERATIEGHVLPTVAAGGRWLGDVQFRNERTGSALPVACNIFALHDRHGEPLGMAAIAHDRRLRERIEGGLRLLARTGAAALDSLDYAATLRNIASALVEEFAAYCIIDALDARQRWERTAIHRDARFQPIIESLSAPSPEHPISRALAAGESTVTAVDDSWARVVGAEDDRLEAIRALGVRSFITVPIFTPTGAIVGALTCALDASIAREDYRDDDLAFVEEVGRRAGAAFANARLYERERRIAVELQAASLPTNLPTIDGLELAAEYRPGSAEATIGGDWYDAFELDDGRIAITVGDVLGHGLHAAVTMTKLRQAMQAAAMLDPDPSAMLRVADKTLRLIDADAYATAIAAIYDPRARTLAYASAGHPGPALRGPTGSVVDLTRSGLMLGLFDGRASEVAVVATPAGSTLVFFTDGLIEATRDIAEGQQRLHDYLASDATLDGLAGARQLVEHVLGHGDASDDIAVLVATIR